jgi:HEAT repeat protein
MFFVVAALAATAGDAVCGPPIDPELDPSSDDLLCRFEQWDTCDGWVNANRWPLLGVSRRATPVAPGAKRLEDAAARARAHDAIVAALGAKDVYVASEAALALGLAGDPADTQKLADIVAAGTAPRRTLRWAAIGLGELPPGNAEQSGLARKTLMQALSDSAGREDDNCLFWANCAYALAMRGDAGSAPEMTDVVKRLSTAVDTRSYLARRRDIYSRQVLAAAWLACGVLGGETVLPELELQLRRPPPKVATGDFTWPLAPAALRIGGAKAVVFLREAAKDDRELTRAVALQALGAACGPKDDESATILKTAIVNERDARCRQMAAVGLGRSGHPSAGAALVAALDRVHTLDRPFVIVGLGFAVRASKDAKLTAFLEYSLERAKSIDRTAWMIACALARIDGARAAVADTIPNGRHGASTAGACFALGQLATTDAEKKLLHEVVAQSVDETSRREAALALGLMRDREVATQLRAIVASKEADRDRGSAACCLGLVGDDADIDALLAVARDKTTSDPLRACVLHGLGRLLDRDEGAKLARVVADGRLSDVRGLLDPFADLRGLVE